MFKLRLFPPHYCDSVQKVQGCLCWLHLTSEKKVYVSECDVISCGIYQPAVLWNSGVVISGF